MLLNVLTVFSSYNCGAQGYDDRGHWGDDCPHLGRGSQDSMGQQIKTWSAEHADQFIDPAVKDSSSEEDGKQSRSQSWSRSRSRSRSQENQSNDSQYDPMEDLEDFVNDRPSKNKKRSESKDEGEIKESTPPPTRLSWYDWFHSP